MVHLLLNCPAAETLRALALGTLPDEELEPIEHHLETCENCRSFVSVCEPDEFVDRLQVSRRTGQTPPPEQKLPFGNLSGYAFPARVGELPTVSPVPEFVPSVPGFTITRKLGEGGMGAVYLAYHETAARNYVLKMVRPDYLARPGLRERFLREIRAAAALGHHPHIVAAYPPVTDGELLVHVMEFVEGHTLAEAVQQNGRLPIETACEYVRQAANGLQHALDQGIIHRDIKPHNLLLTQVNGQSVVKVADFGLAKMVQADDSALTGSGHALGTPDYIAPEQARDASRADTRSDVYALGCTLYYLLTGQPPFPEGSPTEKMLRHVLEPPISVAEYRPEVPPKLVAVVERMMAKDPADRFPTPGSVEAVLVGWSQGRGPKPRSRNRRFSIIGLLGLLVVGTPTILAFSGVLKVRTEQGTIVLRNLPPKAHVAVDGRTVTVSSGARSVDITVTADKPHRLAVRNGTVEVYAASGVTVSAGGEPFIVELQEDTAQPGRTIPPAQSSPTVSAAVPVPEDLLPLEKDGFQPLFDGKSLAGWDLANPRTIKWTTTGAVIRGANHGYHPSCGGAIFTTRHDYQNFHFRCEVLAGQNRETWIWFRHNRTLEHGGRRGYGVPNPPGGEIATRDGWGIGSLYEDVFQVGTQRVKPSQILKPEIRGGEWYGLDIIARGDTIQVYVNRKKSLEYAAQDPPARSGSFGIGCPILSNLAVRNLEVKEFPK